MKFDDFKRKNKDKQIAWFKRHKPKPIIYLASPYFTLSQASSNTRYRYNYNHELRLVPVYINNYNLINRRTIYTKATLYSSKSFSEMTNYR